MRTLVNATVNVKNNKVSKGELWKEIRCELGHRDFLQIRERGENLDISLKTDRFDKKVFYERFRDLSNEEQFNRAKVQARRKIKKALKRALPKGSYKLLFLQDLECNYVSRTTGFIVFEKEFKLSTIIGDVFYAFSIIDKIHKTCERWSSRYGVKTEFFDTIDRKSSYRKGVATTIKVVIHFVLEDKSLNEKERFYKRFIKDMGDTLFFERVVELPEECCLPDRRFYEFEKRDLSHLYNYGLMEDDSEEESWSEIDLLLELEESAF